MYGRVIIWYYFELYWNLLLEARNPLILSKTSYFLPRRHEVHCSNYLWYLLSRIQNLNLLIIKEPICRSAITEIVKPKSKSTCPTKTPSPIKSLKKEKTICVNQGLTLSPIDCKSSYDLVMNSSIFNLRLSLMVYSKF